MTITAQQSLQSQLELCLLLLDTLSRTCSCLRRSSSSNPTKETLALLTAIGNSLQRCWISLLESWQFIWIARVAIITLYHINSKVFVLITAWKPTITPYAVVVTRIALIADYYYILVFHKKPERLKVTPYNSYYSYIMENASCLLFRAYWVLTLQHGINLIDFLLHWRRWLQFFSWCAFSV